MPSFKEAIGAYHLRIFSPQRIVPVGVRFVSPGIWKPNLMRTTMISSWSWSMRVCLCMLSTLFLWVYNGSAVASLFFSISFFLCRCARLKGQSCGDTVISVTVVLLDPAILKRRSETGSLCPSLVATWALRPEHARANGCCATAAITTAVSRCCFHHSGQQ